MKQVGFGKIARIVAVFAVAATVAATAQTYTKLFDFTQTTGLLPSGPLVQGMNGNLYGVTSQGGGPSRCPSGAAGCGTVFEITPEGQLTTLYNFCQQTYCADGAYPWNGLVLATNGNFYGTTNDGGAMGGGTIFEITPEGKFTRLHSFCSSKKSASCPDGESPFGALMQAANGNLYGVTDGGGDYTNCPGRPGGCGLIFQITMAGKYNTFHIFPCSTRTECPDGALPQTGLIQATNGNYIGTTAEGGQNRAGFVYEITPGDKLAILYNFCSQADCSDGSVVVGPPIQAADGTLYGLTQFGGTYGSGVIYDLTLTKKFTDLYDFCVTGCLADPTGLLQATDGNFYGITDFGGTSTFCGGGCGVLYQMTSAGALNTLYSFCSQSNCADGGLPTGLMQATNGMFYGTDNTGSTACEYCGTIFGFSMGFAPFVQANPNFARVGQAVTILGNNLMGTTSVTFNGTSATFTVGSRGTYLKATVPAGATTGTIQVKTPTGTLNSNVKFQVIP